MRTIRQRLIAEFALLVLVGVTLVWLSATWSVRDTFEGYVTEQQRSRSEALAPVLADYYDVFGSWEGVGSYITHPSMPRGRGGPVGPGMGWMRQTQDRVLIYDQSERLVFDSMPQAGQIPALYASLAVDILLGGERIGSVAVTVPGSHGVVGTLEQAFFDRVQTVLMLTGIVSLGLAFFLGHKMAVGISRPLELLRDASREVAEGRVGRKVSGDVSSAPDEIRELVSDFNLMSSELALAESRRTELLRDVAHEIRTPLTIISGNLEALASGAISLDSDTMNAMTEEVGRLEGLVNSLRELDPKASGRQPRAVRLSPRELVDKAVASAHGAGLAQGVSVEGSASPDLPAVLADPDTVRQVFANLLSNALRYTPGGGSILVQASLADSGTVVFRVSDSGPGIAGEDLPRVFDRFFRGDRSRSRATGGWGLGLSIAKGLVERSGGKIWAENTGKGAAFSFTLPQAGSEGFS